MPRTTTVNTLSTYAVSMLAAQGRFLTIHPETMLRATTEVRLLRALPVVLPETRTPVGLIMLKHHIMSPTANVFAEMIRRVIKELIGRQRERRRSSIL